MTLYRLGSRGATVKAIQRKVKVTVDGIYGHKTDSAVRKYQRAHGLEVDGIVGPATMKHMFPPVKVVKPSKVVTRGDRYESYLRAAYFDNPDRKRDYIWGAEGGDDNHDGDPEWDCSGLFHGALVYAGVKDTRTTANGYKNKMHPISRPSQLGDVAYRIVNGHATHIVMWTRGGYFIEARGKDYGIERHHQSTSRLRGLKWYRSDNINAALAARS